MLRISQLANIYGISGKTLRYYDEIGLLKPEIVDKYTGYRYYSSSQVLELNEITLLKEMGLSLKDILNILRGDSNEKYNILKNILNSKKADIDKEIKELKNSKKNIELLEEKLINNYNVELSSYSVGIKKLNNMKVASIKTHISAYSDQAHLWDELLMYLKKEKVKFLPERFTIYYDMQNTETQMEIEVCKRVAMDFKGNDRIMCKDINSQQEVAYLLHTGNHDSVLKSYEKILFWIEENNYEIIDNIQEEFHMEDSMTNNPKEFITEIQIPIKRKG